MSVFIDDPHRPDANLIVDAQLLRYWLTSKSKKALPERPTLELAESPVK
ncbi:MAG TPA: hypothetical protein VHT92_12085 [Candidatus Cybelea sp.]|jgi:hypothetical protein|nr:hypothetical protein [Candidatus Cybelea sp.]